MRIEYIAIIVTIILAVAVCMCLAIANFAYDRFFETFKELDKKQISKTDYTPEKFVMKVNFKHFGGSLNFAIIEKIAGDAYGKGILFLSKSTITNCSIASFAILAHELGHALQDKEGKKLSLLTWQRRIGRILGVLFWPLLLVGAVLMLIDTNLFVIGISLIASGLAIFVFSLIIKFITIKIEKDASKKAIELLERELNEEELKLAKKLLNDAKLTYWGDFFRSLFAWTFLTKKTTMFR